MKTKSGKIASVVIAMSLAVTLPAFASSDFYSLDSGKLRWGDPASSTNDLQGSISPTNGFLNQPWYYKPDNSVGKLTFSDYGFDFILAEGGTPQDGWVVSPTFQTSSTGVIGGFGGTSRRFNIGDGSTSGESSFTVGALGLSGATFQATVAGGNARTGTKVTGTITSSSGFTVNNKQITLLHELTLSPNSAALAAKMIVRNDSNSDLTNVRLAIGTRDDFLDTDDSPDVKERGNLCSPTGFQLGSTDYSLANDTVRVRAGDTGAILHTNYPGARAQIHDDFGSDDWFMEPNVLAKPAGSNNDGQILNDDGSYGLFFNLPNLAPGASTTVEWYFGAGSLADLAAVGQEVCNLSTFRTVFYEIKDPLKVKKVMPATPVRVVAKRLGREMIQISWSRPQSLGTGSLSGYDIYRNGKFATSVSANQSIFLDRQVEKGSSYTYQVVTKTTDGSSNKSRSTGSVFP